MPELSAVFDETARVPVDRPADLGQPVGHTSRLDGQVVDIGASAGQPGLLGGQVPFLLLELAPPERELLVVLVRVPVLKRKQAAPARLDAGLRVGFGLSPPLLLRARPGYLLRGVPERPEMIRGR